VWVFPASSITTDSVDAVADGCAGARCKGCVSGTGRLAADHPPEPLETVAIVEIRAAEELEPPTLRVAAFNRQYDQCAGHEQQTNKCIDGGHRRAP
jgi:hypothetical protein